MTRPGCDVAVAGGGLVGLAVAYELACRGAQVVLVDAAHPGRATDAGAGILSPDTAAVEDDAWWELVHGAGAHYPGLLGRMEADGVDTTEAHYARCGLVSVGLRESEDAWFAPFAERVTSRSGGVVREITPSEAAALFPPLGTVHRALFNPEACRVDGRGMAAGLRRAGEVRGVRPVAGTVGGVMASGSGPSSNGRSVQRVLIEGEDDLLCGALVVAGGAWSAALGERLQCPLPIAPTKGQIVHLGVARETGGWPIVQPLLTHYLVPWEDGRVACGGTFETGAGFDATVTAAGVHELLRECLSVAPGLAGAQYLHTRVGLRPTSTDDRPVVGRVPGWENVWVATGHGANGLLLGPHTARLLAPYVLGGAPADGEPGLPPDLDPVRFT
jgi:D-amino-acid dehydrogenase